MPSLYPGALPPAGSASSTATLADAGHTSLHNTDRDGILAVATKVGTGASTPAANLVLRGTSAGTSAWGQVALADDVSGILPVANGGTGTNTSTGSESVVLSNSPTIVTPTIASFINALHDHENAAGGGQLDGDALSAASIGNTHLTTSAITLGYAQITSDFTSTTTPTFTDITGLSVAVTVPTGGRRVRISVYARYASVSSGAGNGFDIQILEGTTVKSIVSQTSAGANYANGVYAVAVYTPAAGTYTYKTQFSQGAAGTFTVAAGATYPAFILVELI